MSMRKTRQKEAIRRVFCEASGPMSPPEVLASAQHEVPTLGMATVYRCLAELTGNNWLTTLSLAGETRYERADHGHHHHFLCQECHRAFCLNYCQGPLHLHLPAGFVGKDHEVTIHGRCADCAGEGEGLHSTRLTGEKPCV